MDLSGLLFIESNPKPIVEISSGLYSLEITLFITLTIIIMFILYALFKYLVSSFLISKLPKKERWRDGTAKYLIKFMYVIPQAQGPEICVMILSPYLKTCLKVQIRILYRRAISKLNCRWSIEASQLCHTSPCYQRIRFYWSPIQIISWHVRGICGFDFWCSE